MTGGVIGGVVRIGRTERLASLEMTFVKMRILISV